MKRNSSPRAVLFDLDETLVQHSQGSAMCWSEALSMTGLATNGSHAVLLRALLQQHRALWSTESWRRRARWHVEHATFKIVMSALRLARITLPAEQAECLATCYRKLRHASLVASPDVPPLLASLRALGIRTAVVSNGTRVAQAAKLARFELAQHFEFVQTREDVGHLKPDTRVFARALRNLGVRPSEAWFVGDDLVEDIAGAQRCGMAGVWLARMPRQNNSIVPTHAVTALGAITQLLGIEGHPAVSPS